MKVTDSKTYLLQFAVTSSFLGFLIIVSITSVMTQQRVVSETITPIVNGVTWMEYYPTWFFQILTILTVVALAGWTVSMGRVFGKRYPNLHQLASTKTSLLSIFLLNVLFLGTSHVLSYPPFPLYQTYNAVFADLSIDFGLDGPQLYDLAAALLIAIMIVSTYLRHLSHGPWEGSLSAIQIVSAALLPLGIEVFAFDNSEWNLHVTQFQASYHIIPWFTNADLFLSCIILFVSVTLLKWHALQSKTPGIED